MQTTIDKLKIGFVITVLIFTILSISECRSSENKVELTNKMIARKIEN